MRNRLEDCLSKVRPIYWPSIVCVFIISELWEVYLVQFFLFSLFFDSLVFPQKLLIVFIVIVFWLWMNSRLFGLILVVRFDKGLWICIFGEGIICQIDQLFSDLIWSFYFFLHVWLIAADDIDIPTVNRVIFIVSDLLLFDDLDLAVLFASCLCLSLDQLCLEILLF